MEIAPVALSETALAKLDAAVDGITRVCFAIPPELVPLRSLTGLVDSAWMGTGPGPCSTRWVGTAGSLCGFSRFTTSFVTSVD